jgi:beta-glucosidase
MNVSFPPSFAFGVADADLQVIGEDHTLREEQSEKTMWYDFGQNSGRVHENATPGPGVDRYHLWKSDIEIMKSLGVRHYRTSVSMSRILKENGEPNPKTITWYTNYFKALKKAGIAIYATLYHWELPLYLHKTGGWKNPKTIDVFLKHTQTVAKELGEYIDEYFILNEPWCASLLSYHLGIHAPGEKSLASGLLASHHLLLAQGRTYNILKSIDKTLKVSTVFNTETAYPYSQNPKDVTAAKRADGYFNRWFFDPLFLGAYPSDMVELYDKAMPKTTKEELKEIHIGDKLYTMGINYYCGRLNKWDDTAELGYTSVLDPKGPTNDLGWPICIPPAYPEGFYDMLTQTWDRYKDHGLKRMLITENGMALKSELTGDGIRDARRVEYLREHIRQVHKAMESGIPVEGYFAWTLMDNYEWAEGYKPNSCFGMIYVDRNTMKRILKDSALWYADVMKSHAI